MLLFERELETAPFRGDGARFRGGLGFAGAIPWQIGCDHASGRLIFLFIHNLASASASNRDPSLASVCTKSAYILGDAVIGVDVVRVARYTLCNTLWLNNLLQGYKQIASAKTPEQGRYNKHP